MSKETLFFTSPCHLKITHQQLVIINKEDGTMDQRCVGELGIVLLEHPAITFTQQVMKAFAQHRVAVVYCDEARYPCAMLLHMQGHHSQTQRFHQQVQSSLPLKKQLWRQTIQAKLYNQRATLDAVGVAYATWPELDKVESGDVTNQEAYGARLYWKSLWGKSFRRARNGPAPNPALNYGYAILRAAMARALAGAGLLPILGIHHKNKYSTFCLADDIMEPYRPMVDRRVYNLINMGLDAENLGRKEKVYLLHMLQDSLMLQDQKVSIMYALQQSATSLAQCFAHEKKKIIYPRLTKCKPSRT